MNSDDWNLTEDPDNALYQALDAQLRTLTWRQFEEMTTDLLRELGFYSVQRLTSGSQHGKDVVAVWDSRFHLGKRVRFRVQVKHKETAATLTKAEVGDSIADFVVQHDDKVLLIVTNGDLANDLLDQVDRLLREGHSVHAVSRERLFRLIYSCAKTAERYLGISSADCRALRHHFEFVGWIDSIATQVEIDVVKLSFVRFWTEPYTWFFYKNGRGDIVREWTTVGGDFRFSCHNATSEVQRVGRIVLRLLEHEALPEFYVLNTSPKGGRALPKVEVPLSSQLGEFELVSAAESAARAGAGR